MSSEFLQQALGIFVNIKINVINRGHGRGASLCKQDIISTAAAFFLVSLLFLIFYHSTSQVSCGSIHVSEP